MIDPTFRSINRMIVLSFTNGKDDPSRVSCDKYNMPLVEIKDFNALIDHELFFDVPIKSKQEAYEKLVKMSRNNDYKQEINYFSYYQNYYKLFVTDFSRQRNMSIP